MVLKPIMALSLLRRYSKALQLPKDQVTPLQKILEIAYTEGRCSSSTDTQLIEQTEHIDPSAKAIAAELDGDEKDALRRLELGESSIDFADFKKLISKELAWFDFGEAMGGITSLGAEVVLALRQETR